MLDVILLFRESLFGALIIALGCSVLGVYIVLRRIVFVGAALAQLSSAGVALAIFLGALGLGGPLRHELLLSLLAALAGVVFFALHGERYRVPPDAGLGVAYVAAGAAGVLLIARAAGADVHDLFLEGNILGISRGENLLLLGVVGTVIATHALLAKEFVFISFDPEMARTLGYRVRLWTLVLYLTFGVVIAVAIRSAGVLLVFDFLVLPAVTGLLLGRSLRGVFAWAIASGAAAALIGFAASVPFDLPTGPAMIAASTLLLACAWLAALPLRRNT